MTRGAYITDDGIYRYSLWRTWDEAKPRIVFIGLNPSTADAEKDDPTIRRCIRFAQDWGYGGLNMMNLFAYRATDPKELKKALNPVGPRNDLFLKRIMEFCDKVVFAWGAHGSHMARNSEVRAMFPKAYCLGKTKAGYPRHPLYIKADTKLVRV